MANWLLIALVVAAAAGLFALAWWSSGRARTIGRRTMTADQRLEVERTRFQHQAPPDSFGTNQH